jgi:hypothetical protein
MLCCFKPQLLESPTRLCLQICFKILCRLFVAECKIGVQFPRLIFRSMARISLCIMFCKSALEIFCEARVEFSAVALAFKDIHIPHADILFFHSVTS